MSSKPLFGPPPPAELGSGKLLSQGAEARIWLLNLAPQSAITPSTTLASNIDTTGGCGHDGSSNSHTNTMKNEKITTTSTISTLRKMHVGGGIHVPHIMHISQLSKQQQPPPLFSSSTSSKSCSSFIIVKERFPKKYRHPSLDSSLTKNRTRGEARALIRCLKAGVSCPNVLGIGHWPSSLSSSSSNINTNKTNPNGTATMSSSSSCLVLEWIEGCTVRQYLEHRSSTSSSSSLLAEEPNTKRPRFNTEDEDGNILITPLPPPNNNGQDRITTPIDAQTLCVARSIGHLVGKMHAAGIIHGDLTTSNIMLRNPPWTNISSSSSSRSISVSGNTTIIVDGEDYDDEGAPWKPQLALIDFGLASSTTTTTSTTTTNNTTSNNKNTHKQQHNAEEKAVDLYVLERAFLSSHPESERLVEELLDGYRDYYFFVTALDGTNLEDAGADDANTVTKNRVIATSSTTTTTTADGTTSSRETSPGSSTQAANMILNRLEQVRMRGRKRECFG